VCSDGGLLTKRASPPPRKTPAAPPAAAIPAIPSAARALLLAFAVIGFVASAAATWVHYQLLRNPDYTAFCDINATVSCRDAYLSQYGSIGGIPVAVGGLFFFAFVLLLLWAGRGRSRAADSVPAYLLVVSTLALGFVLYLAYASFFVLKQACPLCIATYIAVIGLFVLSSRYASIPFSRLPGRAVQDVGAAATSPLALLLAVVFVGSAVAVITAFPAPEERPAVAPLVPLPQDQRAELARWFDLQPKADLPFATNGAKVVVIKFNDFQCPPCKATYFGYEPVVAKYKDRPSEVQFLLKHFPLEPECNPNVTNTAHPAACDAAAAELMAQQRGTADKLTDWFFMHQEELSPATVRRAAREIGHIDDFDARYPQVLQDVRKDATIGGKAGVESTPTFFVNGRKVAPAVSPSALDALIELELQRAKGP
jgi:uncharacterized membrane protein/protein-disulfide isomerase